MAERRSAGPCLGLVREIRWERMHLFLDVDVPVCGAFFLVDERGAATPLADVRPQENGRVRLHMNITAVAGARPLAPGRYRLKLAEQEGYFGLDDTLTKKLPELQRVFPFGRDDEYALTFTFTLEENDAAPALVLAAQAMGPVDMQTLKPIRPRGKKRLREAAFACGGGVLRALYRLRRLFAKKDGKTVAFISDSRPVLAGNLLAIHERLQQRGLTKSLRVLFSLRASSKKQSLLSWLRLVGCFARADVVFLDDHQPLLNVLTPDPRTVIVQAWHAGLGFKAVGYSRYGHRNAPPPIRCGHRKITYALCGSGEVAHWFAEVFGVPEERILPLGLPRLDGYLAPEHAQAAREAFYARYPALVGKRVILFAPTFRGSGEGKAYYDFDRIDFAALYDSCGEDTAVLFKMHPYIHGEVPIPAAYADRLFAADPYCEINELFFAVDLLITDYSSAIYEFALHHKPMLFFAYDEAAYSVIRGFHLDYEAAAPGKVCRSFAELLAALRAGDFEQEKAEAYAREHFPVPPGGAADRVIDAILRPAAWENDG